VSVHAIVPDLEHGRQAVEAGASVLRLARGASTEATIAAGRGLRRFGTPFYVVDDLDAALELGADGLHLELEPERGEDARALGLRIGAQASTLDGLATLAAYLEVAPAVGNGGDWLDELAAICAAAPTAVIVSGPDDPAAAAAFISAGASGVVVTGIAGGRALRAAVDAALAARRGHPVGRRRG
jgi:thiamine-phosphate pyrophosphorylase